jgi:cystathionine gamma-synthase
MSLFGGMMSIQLVGGEKAATTLTTLTKLFTLAPSLGGVESLIEHPGLMTHHSVEGTALEVPANLVRISVGIEDIDDLIEDLAQALDSLL